MGNRHWSFHRVPDSVRREWRKLNYKSNKWYSVFAN